MAYQHLSYMKMPLFYLVVWLRKTKPMKFSSIFLSSSYTQERKKERERERERERKKIIYLSPIRNSCIAILELLIFEVLIE